MIEVFEPRLWIQKSVRRTTWGEPCNSISQIGDARIIRFSDLIMIHYRSFESYARNSLRISVLVRIVRVLALAFLCGWSFSAISGAAESPRYRILLEGGSILVDATRAFLCAIWRQ